MKKVGVMRSSVAAPPLFCSFFLSPFTRRNLTRDQRQGRSRGLILFFSSFSFELFGARFVIGSNLQPTSWHHNEKKTWFQGENAPRFWEMLIIGFVREEP